MPVTMLLIDDDTKAVAAARRALDPATHLIDAAPNTLDGLNKLLSYTYDVVLCADCLSQMRTLALLKHMKARGLEVPCIVVTLGGASSAWRLTRCGKVPRIIS